MKSLRFILSYKVPRSLRIKDQLNAIALEDSWFYLHRTCGFVRVFPGDKMPDALPILNKSHISKIMFLTALAQPLSDRNFDGRLATWNIYEEKV